ncbi:MAG: hypothetical protein FWD43_05295 [Coriobacteriia bacterium]|nr:hypothetical protein [Coriobacteriia bacterium]
MFDVIDVNPRISKRHPEILETDILSAWKNAFVIVERSGAPLPDAVLVALGSDTKGRLIEMVGSVTRSGTVHIFHAMTPPSKKTLEEVGFER